MSIPFDRVKWGPPLEVFLRAQYKLVLRNEAGEWRTLCIERATPEEFKEWLEGQLKVGAAVIELNLETLHRLEVKMEIKTTISPSEAPMNKRCQNCNWFGRFDQYELVPYQPSTQDAPTHLARCPGCSMCYAPEEFHELPDTEATE